jgi:hypothetical protein
MSDMIKLLENLFKIVNYVSLGKLFLFSKFLKTVDLQNFFIRKNPCTLNSLQIIP